MSRHTAGPKRRTLSSESSKQELRFEASGETLYLYYYAGTRRDRSGKRSIRALKNKTLTENHITAYISHRTRERAEREAQIGDKAIARSPSLSADEISHQAAAVFGPGAETRREERGKGDVPLVSVILHGLH